MLRRLEIGINLSYVKSRGRKKSEVTKKKYEIEFDLKATDNNGKTPMESCRK